MSAASAARADRSPAVPRPRLVVIHSAEPDDAPAAPVPAAPAAIQQELPLRWPLDRGGEAAASVLAAYPPLPLQADIPRPDPYVAHAARLIADVLVGARPASQVSRYAVLDVQQQLSRRIALRRADRSWTPVAARVSSTNTMVVSGAAVQVAVVFFAGRRVHAAALRMEYRHRRWLVTQVQTPA